MSKVLDILGSDGEVVGYGVRCPACDAEDRGHMHVFYRGSEGRQGWSFDGDYANPTFSPSMLARANYGPENTPHVCHSFVRGGKIQYLNDCTHAMRGQTVELPPWED